MLSLGEENTVLLLITLGLLVLCCVLIAIVIYQARIIKSWEKTAVTLNQRLTQTQNLLAETNRRLRPVLIYSTERREHGRDGGQG